MKLLAKLFLYIFFFLLMIIIGVYISLQKERNITNLINYSIGFFTENINSEKVIAKIDNYKYFNLYVGKLDLKTYKAQISLHELKLEKNILDFFVLNIIPSRLLSEKLNIKFFPNKKGFKDTNKKYNSSKLLKKLFKVNDINLEKITLVAAYENYETKYEGSIRIRKLEPKLINIQTDLSEFKKKVSLNLNVNYRDINNPKITGNFKNLPIKLLTNFMGLTLYNPDIYLSGEINTESNSYDIKISEIDGKVFNPNNKYLTINKGNGELRVSNNIQNINVNNINIDLENDIKAIININYNVASSNLVLKVNADNIDLRNVSEFWPEEYLGGVKNWINTSVKEGTTDNLDLNIELKKDKLNKLKLKTFNLSFLINNTKLFYSADLAPIDKLKARLFIDSKKLIAEVLEGIVYNTSVKNSKFRLDFVKEEIEIEGKLESGKVSNLIDLLYDSSLLEHQKFLENIEGNFKGNFNFRLPITQYSTLRDKLFFNIELDNLKGILPYNNIRFDNGESKVVYSDSELKLDGKINLDQDTSHIKLVLGNKEENSLDINLEINSKVTAENSKTYLPSQLIFLEEGEVLARTIYKKTNKEEILSVDIKDLNESIITVPYLKFSTKKDDKLHLFTQIDLFDKSIKTFSLTGENISIHSDINYNIDKNIGTIKIKDGKWHDNLFNLYLKSDTSNSEIILNSNHLDLSNSDFSFLRKKDNKKKNIQEIEKGIDKNYKIFIEIEKLLLSKDKPIYALDIFLNTKEGNLSELHIEGKLPSLKPFNISTGKLDNGDISIKAIAEDAGELLKVTKLYNKLNKGKLTLEGIIPASYPKEKAEAKLEIKSVFLEEDSIFMQLINLSTPTSLIYSLANKGTYYSSVSSDLYYQDNILTISNLKALSDALDIKLNGEIDLKNEEIKLKGKVIPGLFILNAVSKNIPIIGKLFSNAKEALINADFSIKGNFDKPKISINPLSIFTPDIRKFFDTKSEQNNMNTRK